MNTNIYNYVIFFLRKILILMSYSPFFSLARDILIIEKRNVFLATISFRTSWLTHEILKTARSNYLMCIWHVTLLKYFSPAPSFFKKRLIFAIRFHICQFMLGFIKGIFYNSFLQKIYISCQEKKKNRSRKKGKEAITDYCILVSCIILTCIEMLLKCLSMNGRGQIRCWVK